MPLPKFNLEVPVGELRVGHEEADNGGEWTVVGASGAPVKREGAAAGGSGRPHKKKAKRAMELAAFASTDVYHQARAAASPVEIL